MQLAQQPTLPDCHMSASQSLRPAQQVSCWANGLQTVPSALNWPRSCVRPAGAARQAAQSSMSSSGRQQEAAPD